MKDKAIEIKTNLCKAFWLNLTKLSKQQNKRIGHYVCIMLENDQMTESQVDVYINSVMRNRTIPKLNVVVNLLAELGISYGSLFDLDVLDEDIEVDKKLQSKINRYLT